jgi:glycosyltransferase involved in cell wall biosynthesis
VACHLKSSSRANASGSGVTLSKAGSEAIAAEGHPRLRIGMAVYGDITFDSRVRREAETLAAAGHTVVLACLPGSVPSRWAPVGVHVLPLLPKASATLPGPVRPIHGGARGRRVRAVARSMEWLAGYVRNVRSWGGLVTAAVGDCDAWHAHDLAAMVAISARVAKPTPIIYDSHELFLDTGGGARLPPPLRSLAARIERAQVRRADTLITVNDELAAILDRRYHPRRTVVVRNCPPRTVRYGGPDLLRGAIDIRPDQPLILYHGLLAPNRGLDTLAAALLEPGLEHARAVFMGFGGWRDHLERLAADPRFEGRVHVLDAVPADELLAWIASADVGALALPSTDLNLRNATPNKLFECIAAGVPVIVSDVPAIRRIVDDPSGPLGVYADPTSPTSLAGAIRSILERPPAERTALSARCHAAADRRWNWETESEALLGIYDRIATRSGHHR